MAPLDSRFDRTPSWHLAEGDGQVERRAERRLELRGTTELWAAELGGPTAEVIGFTPRDLSVHGVGLAADGLERLRGVGEGDPMRLRVPWLSDGRVSVHETRRHGRTSGVLRLRDVGDLFDGPRPGRAASSPCSGRPWLAGVLARLNPTLVSDVAQFGADPLLETFRGYWKHDDAEIQEERRELLRDRLEALRGAFATVEAPHPAGWISIVRGLRQRPDGSPLVGREEPLGLVCFQPMSQGVVLGHQIAVGSARHRAEDRARRDRARAEVRRVLYLGAFEPLDYVSWVEVLAGVYIVRDGSDWMARAHGGFARTLPAADAVDFPIQKVALDSAAVGRFPRTGVACRVGPWDDEARTRVREIVRHWRQPLYVAAMELNAPLDTLPTPFTVSIADHPQWRASRAYASQGPQRARRALWATDAGELVGVGVLDAVDWPVNVSGLLDAVRLYPVGEARTDPTLWRRARWGMLREAARWYEAAQVEGFVYFDEPCARVTEPRPPDEAHPAIVEWALATPRPEADLDDLIESHGGRQWALRRAGERYDAEGRPVRGRFASFAAFAEARVAEEPAAP